MRISVKASLQNVDPKNGMVIREFAREYPYQFRNKYFSNARAMTPNVSGKLLGSLGSNVFDNKATIVWRAPYAAAVNKGGHTDKKDQFVPARGFGHRSKLWPQGAGYQTRAGWFHPYKTGSEGFINRIGMKTFDDMEDYVKMKLGKK